MVDSDLVQTIEQMLARSLDKGRPPAPAHDLLGVIRGPALAVAIGVTVSLVVG
jgi:hypothetical protein